MKNIILLLLLISTNAYSDMNDCAKITNLDDKNYCMATYSGSSTFCEKLKSFERKTQCMRMVVAFQRKAQYSTIKQKEKQEE